MIGGELKSMVQRVKFDFDNAEISENLKGLLAIAGKVQIGGRNVTSEGDDPDFYRARAAIVAANEYRFEGLN